MDHARRTSPVAHAGEHPEAGARSGVPTLVSGCAAGRRAPGGLTPSFLMLSPSRLSADHHWCIVADLQLVVDPITSCIDTLFAVAVYWRPFMMTPLPAVRFWLQNGC